MNPNSSESFLSIKTYKAVLEEANSKKAIQKHIIYISKMISWQKLNGSKEVEIEGLKEIFLYKTHKEG